MNLLYIGLAVWPKTALSTNDALSSVKYKNYKRRPSNSYHVFIGWAL